MVYCTINHNLRLVLTCNPARAERETAFALDFPESFPALPPAYKKQSQIRQKYEFDLQISQAYSTNYDESNGTKFINGWLESAERFKWILTILSF